MAHFDVKELEKRKKEDLQKLANELGLSDIGTKEELAKRIAAVDAEEQEEKETQKKVERDEDGFILPQKQSAAG